MNIVAVDSFKMIEIDATGEAWVYSMFIFANPYFIAAEDVTL